MAVLVGIDAGTTGVRSVLIDEDGRMLASAYREFPQYFPRPGWVEHDAREIWSATLETLASVSEHIVEAVAGIGITNQRETIVVWDSETGRPLAPAIVWQDRRTSQICAELSQAGLLDTIRTKTGLVLDPYFSATKLQWLLRDDQIRSNRNLRVGTIDSWLIFCLTAGKTHVTDVTNASRTMLFNLDSLAWDDELLELFEVPPETLAKIVANNERVGVTANTTALGAGVPISGIAGDQQAALFGQACFYPGLTKNTYGTGSFVLMNVGEKRPAPAEGLLTTVAWSLLESEGRITTSYALEGSIFATGAAVQWLRDGLEIIDSAEELESLALKCEHTHGVVLVPAFAGLGSPWWDPDARGALFGLTRGTSKAQLARATIESMVFQTRDVVDAMALATGMPIHELRVDGGASVMNTLIQMQADQLRVSVTRAAHPETTVRGAVFLAGLAEGVWDSLAQLSALAENDFTALPVQSQASANAAHQIWLDALRRVRTTRQPTMPPQ